MDIYTYIQPHSTFVQVEEFELVPLPRTTRSPGLVAVDGELWPFATTRARVLPAKMTLLGVGGGAKP